MKRMKKEEMEIIISNYYDTLNTTDILEREYQKWLEEYSFASNVPYDAKRVLWEHITDLDIVWSNMTEFAEKYNDTTVEYIAKEVDKALRLIDPEHWKSNKTLMSISARNLRRNLNLALPHLKNALSTLLKIGKTMDCTYIKRNSATLWHAVDVSRLYRAIKGMELCLEMTKRRKLARKTVGLE